MSWIYRLLLPWAHRIRRVYWYLLRPQAFGVVCLIEYQENVLLVQHSYIKDKWAVPGGGIKRGEDAATAVRREVWEEVGIGVPNLRELGTVYSTREFKRDTITCFWARITDNKFMIDNKEIIRAGWFPIGHLPEDSSWLLDEIVGMRREISE